MKRLYVLLLLILSICSAKAAVITFAPLAGPNDAPYAGHVEGPWTVAPILGNWFQALAYGNPTPSIFDGPIFNPGVAAIRVTDTVLPFTFNSLDYSSNNGPSTAVIQGFLGGALVFLQNAPLAPSLPPAFGFTMLASANPNTIIDQLDIQIQPTLGGGVTSINLDNINVSKIPEPWTLLLVGTALALVWYGKIARTTGRKVHR